MRRVGILYERREDRAFEELRSSTKKRRKYSKIYSKKRKFIIKGKRARPPLSLSLSRFSFSNYTRGSLLRTTSPFLPYRDQRGEGTRIVQRGNTIAEDTEYGKNLICLLERGGGGGGGYRSDISRRRGGEWNRTDTVCPVR